MGLPSPTFGHVQVMLTNKLAKRLGLVGVLCALTICSHEARAEPLLIGVGTHFGQGRTNLQEFRDWSATAGIASLRDDVYWSHIERRPQQLEWQYSSRDARDAFRALSPVMQPLVILGGSNGLYDDGHQPVSRDAVKAFGAYARWVARELRTATDLFEVWNEWNIGTSLPSNKSRGDANNYARLAERAIVEVRSVNPTARILVGGSTDDFPDWRWVRELVASGLLAKADGLSVHLYNHCDRTSVGSDELLSRLDSLKRILDMAGLRDLPIYVTEVGWPTHVGQCGVSESEAAAYTLRFMLGASARPWLKGIWLYEFMDGGENNTDQEQRFGLLRRNGEEKPAGCIVRAEASTIAKRPVTIFRRGTWTAMTFASGSSATMMLWRPQTAGGSSLVKIRSPAGELDASVMDICGLAGRAQVVQRTKDTVTLRADGKVPMLVRVGMPVGSLEVTAID